MIKRVIIHAGTMKTGTTALQIYMNDRRETHAAHGVYYPSCPPGRFNHQQLQRALKNGNGGAFLAAVAQGISESPKNTHTVFFSHEGIHEGWQRYAPNRREDLRKLSMIYPLELWVVFREPLEYMLSLHNQYAKRATAEVKGQPHLTMEQRLEQPHFLASLNYRAFVKSVEKLIAPKKVRVMAYSRNMIRETMQALALPFDDEDEPIHNRSISQKAMIAIEQIRRANLTEDEKEVAANMVVERDIPGLARMIPPETVLAVARACRLEHEHLRTIAGDQLKDYWPPHEDVAAAVLSQPASDPSEEVATAAQGEGAAVVDAVHGIVDDTTEAAVINAQALSEPVADAPVAGLRAAKSRKGSRKTA